jgi:phospholipid N-methyltransferase
MWKEHLRVGVGGGIGDFTYQIILQSLLITKNYQFKNIKKIVVNI